MQTNRGKTLKTKFKYKVHMAKESHFKSKSWSLQ